MKAQVFSRRIMLRAILAASYGLWIPITMSANDKDKGTDASKPPATTMKVPQASVQYQATPMGEQKCATCRHFIAESNTCKLVEGNIAPDGWCTLWATIT